MKRMLVFLLVPMATVLGLTVKAHADLTVRSTDSLGNQLINDSGLNVTSYDYSNTADTWQKQVNRVFHLTENLDGQNGNGWLLPTTMDDPWSTDYNGAPTADYSIMSSLSDYYADLGNTGNYNASGNPQPFDLNNPNRFKKVMPYLEHPANVAPVTNVNVNATPVPIPSTLGLLASGLAGMAAFSTMFRRRHW